MAPDESPSPQPNVTGGEPELWVSPIDLRAWQRAKAGEIWAWSENVEGQCVPLYRHSSTSEDNSAEADKCLTRYAMVFDGEEGWIMLADPDGEYVKFSDIPGTPPQPSLGVLDQIEKLVEAYVGGEFEAQGCAAEQILADIRELRQSHAPVSNLPGDCLPNGHVILEQADTLDGRVSQTVRATDGSEYERIVHADEAYGVEE